MEVAENYYSLFVKELHAFSISITWLISIPLKVYITAGIAPPHS